MSFFSSSKFASASASGTDWRDTARAVLELIEQARARQDDFNIGFIYMSDVLADDAVSIINLCRTVTGIDHWTGSVGLGICAVGVEYVDEPAISILIGRIPEEEFCVFPPIELDLTPAQQALENWVEDRDPMLVLVHGDPVPENDPVRTLSLLGRMTGGYVAGGMSSSRTKHLQFADEVVQGGVSGVAFSQSVAVATVLTQGCAPVGPVHTITRCDEHVIMELDGQRAFDVFSADLKEMARQQHKDSGEDKATDQEKLFRGEVHVAFPVPGSDTQDYLVRNAMGIDPDKGWIAVAHQAGNGEQMMFVHRDHETVRADLSRKLLELRDRITAEQGVFAPQGALYISCVARTMSDFGDGTGGEMRLVREIIGDVPLAGFYADGEISNDRLYGYTALLILFL
ncbi:MAG: FIST C-terminal domain-containing protein [Rhodospirillales bacterium]|nr:FIST C-terminal domain-containing protein [Rhodospirillales bacterium]MCB9996978.1 FIST C-terminal domain-containing protein [Rhodospirillales bacterium]